MSPKVIECDNELGEKKPRIQRFLKDKWKIKIEPSAAHTQDQNGGAERSGATIKEKARAMGINLPNQLFKEAARAAVYLTNRTPRYLNNWKSPYQLFYGHPPRQDHLRAYGCKAFAMTSEAKKKKHRLQRLNRKAWIGYLVGYASTNIYRIWIPMKNKVILTRDVIFDEEAIFDGRMDHLAQDVKDVNLEHLANYLQSLADEAEGVEDADEISADPMAMEDSGLFEDEAEDDTNEPHENPESLPDAESESPEVGEPHGYGPETLEYGAEAHECGPKTYEFGLATPSESSPAALLSATIQPCYSQMSREERTPSEIGQQRTDHPAACLGSSGSLGEAAARLGIGATDCTLPDARMADQPGEPERDTGKADTVSGRTVLSDPRAEDRAGCPDTLETWQGAFLAGRMGNGVVQIAGKIQSRGKLHQMLKNPKNGSPGEDYDRERLQQLLRNPSARVHRRDLPPPPGHHGELRSHPLGPQFEKAELDHLESHRQMQSWAKVSKRTLPRYRRLQILDSMWRYVYKFDKHGRLEKCKARLVVRGDQQICSGREETYAATLAGRSFRSLIALAARFDLEMIQFDAVNAFCHATLNEDIYMRMPVGHCEPGFLFKLQRALYRLRTSPALWHRMFTTHLREIGFSPVPHEPSCYTLGAIVIFFYVDDIVLAFREEERRTAENLVERIKQKFNLSGGEDLQWFLGVEVIRDRERGLIWLAQYSYVDKISKLMDTNPSRTDTPMGTEELTHMKGRQQPKRFDRSRSKSAQPSTEQ